MTKYTKLTDEKWVNLFKIEDDAEGRPPEWIMASREQEPEGKADVPNAVIVAALVEDGDEEKLVVGSAWRPCIQGVEYSLPAGLIDEGESVEDAARREFHEETGMILDEIEMISPNLFTSSGLSDESVVIVLASAYGEPSKDKQEDHENIDIHLLGAEDRRRFVAQEGEFANIKTNVKTFLAIALLASMNGDM